MRKHELLAPAGSMDIAKAVIAAGADAVYLGGDKFGARAYASNLDRDHLMEIIDYAHMYGRKIHLTVNTILKNREIQEELYSYMEPLYRHGLDAVIVQDFGVFSFLHRNFPGLQLHASTQTSVTGADGARFFQKNGASRIVMARELSLEEIREIYDQTGMELECFIHGALCYCYSGQCLMSSMIGGRSGNRGRCAQPCRLPYQVSDRSGKKYCRQEKYPLSPKDLCAIDLIPDLCEAGVYSFKIEGRMKHLEYAAGVTEIYRKYLDLYESDPDHFKVDPADYQALLKLGNRSGFTRGYAVERNGRDMLSSENSAHNSEKAAGYKQPDPKKTPVKMECSIRIGKPARLRVLAGSQEAVADGATVSPARKQPLTSENLKKRLSKTGNSPYMPQEIAVDMDENAFLPVSAINEVRRNALDALTEQILDPYRRSQAGPPVYAAGREEKNEQISSESGVQLAVSVTRRDMLSEVLKNPMVGIVDLDFADAPAYDIQAAIKQIHHAGKLAGYCFPYIFRKETADRLTQLFSDLQADRYLVRSYDSLGFALDRAGIPADRIVLDYNMYVFSRESAAAFAQKGIRHYTVSLELNGREIKHQQKQGAEVILYGYTPLMISAQCIYKNYRFCEKKHPGSDRLYLTDRYHNRFEAVNHCADCYNVIYNSRALNLLDQTDQIRGMGYHTFRICLTDENAQQIRDILRDCRKALTDGEPALRYKKEQFQKMFTRGHYNRGVE